MATIPLRHKILSCLLAGVVSGFSFHRIANRFAGRYLPQAVLASVGLALIAGTLLYILIWHHRERRRTIDTVSMLAFWQGVIRFALAFDLSMFGWQKISGGFQFFTPMAMLDEPFSTLSLEWLTWSYFGRSYPMIVSIAIFQIAGAYLLLFRRTRLIGIFILLPVLLNILLIDIFYKLHPWVAIHAFVVINAIVYLLLSEYDRLKAFFLNREGGDLPVVRLKASTKNVLRVAVLVAPALLIIPYLRHNRPPEIMGKYVVQQISINNEDRTADMHCDSVLSVVYFDVANECVFEFRDYRQRTFGSFDHQSQGRLQISWRHPKGISPMEGTLSPAGGRRWKLSGKTGNDLFEADLEKVK